MGEIVPVTRQGPSADSLALTFAAQPLTEEAYEERLKGAQELEAKLKHIQETVPTKVYNVSSSSAGAGSGDFHQYRIVRRAEQDRVRKMEADDVKKQQEDEYRTKMEALNKVTEERTAKKRAKRLKKKAAKKSKKGPGAEGAAAGGEEGKDSGDSGSDDEEGVQPALD